MKRWKMVPLISAMILSASLLAGNSWAKYETIPPEILQQYDPGIVSGERPEFTLVNNEDIWDLREHPERGGDLVLLQLNIHKLSSPQIETIKNWVRQGARVYLNSRDSVYWLIKPIFGMNHESLGYVRQTQSVYSRPYPNETHPVMTDVESELLCRSTCLGVTGLPEERSVILSADKSHTIVMIGAFKYGQGHIYFNTLTNPYGRDLERFGLNLNQWLIGKEVPGSATTEIFGYTSREVSREQVKRYDLLTLRNGDSLSGTILNESFTIQTTYATLSFPKEEIKRIIFESERVEIQIMELERGDILRGVIRDEIIYIDIPSAGENPIEQDKIREIDFAQKETAD
jgi:hypothetical protein